MANPHRGDVEASFGGRVRVFRLTLGALAELEAKLGADGIAGLAARFEGGRVSAADLLVTLACGLRGAGEAVTDDEVAGWPLDGGVAAAAKIAADLLRATFAEP
ncbi:MAG: gene transfer agent family protein [Hyphomicrobiales bacterium]|nr:gene transfer agent family protein [Hyphomicrobiales bacterium]MDE2018600.1 gene transfer agent family protein [Hyphomicrobiales bacterium]